MTSDEQLLIFVKQFYPTKDQPGNSWTKSTKVRSVVVHNLLRNRVSTIVQRINVSSFS